MKILAKIKMILRGVRDFFLLLLDSTYDFYQYFRYSGMFAHKSRKTRIFKTIKIYHALEKSLSFRDRRSGAGWVNAVKLATYLEDTYALFGHFSFHEKIGVKVLKDFCDHSQAPLHSQADLIEKFLKRHENMLSVEGGAVAFSTARLEDGKLERPESFFKSRYSVRDFSARNVEQTVIKRAIELAMKTPSACNRQPWHVYHFSDRESIDHALSFQTGNKGFGHEVPCLMIIAADMRAFEASLERNQHLIDGGMFSMSMVMALHSLGVGSCCLNWSQGAKGDLRIRRGLDISPHHAIIMMLAVGYPREHFKVCCSARSPFEEVYSQGR